MRRIERAILAAAALLAVGGASAGSNGSVEVRITLTSAPGTCVSASAAGGNVGLVQVACGSPEFVDITPAGVRGLRAGQGGAQRYAVGGVETAWSYGDPALGAWGTVTAFRVVGLDRQPQPVEMLVSF